MEICEDEDIVCLGKWRLCCSNMRTWSGCLKWKYNFSAAFSVLCSFFCNPICDLAFEVNCCGDKKENKMRGQLF